MTATAPESGAGTINSYKMPSSARTSTRSATTMSAGWTTESDVLYVIDLTEKCDVNVIGRIESDVGEWDWPD